MAVIGRRVGALAGALLLVAGMVVGCSGSDGGSGDLDDAAPPPTGPSSTTSTTVTTTSSTTEPTMTALSDEEAAEAEIRRVVIEWYQLPVDSTQDAVKEAHLEPLAGLLRQRTVEFEAGLAEDGVIRRSRQPAPIEVTGTTVDLADGDAEVEACTGSAEEFLDVETGEVLSADDPDDTFASTFYLQLVDGRWKINEWIPARTDGQLISCEIES